MRILLVEDETPIANFIRDGLREEGFAVDVADNGRTDLDMALGLLEEYDLFLLDWMLPGVSG
ncbi:MAG: response regulator, partial [Phaeodactylibacter sp.]|nr:response regulator [Phaeodactylibacter sp.]